MGFNPKAFLEKQGWSEGKGLGKNNQGIATIVKTAFKFDKAGFGHKVEEQFNIHTLWSHSYNKAAQRMKSITNEDGSVKVQLAPSSPKIKDKSSKSRKFVKSTTISNGVLVEDSSSDDDSDLDSDNSAKGLSKYTDEELFKICGGLTAHSAARHGIKQTAKLSRLRMQDEAARILRDSELSGSKENQLNPIQTGVAQTDLENYEPEEKIKKKQKHKTTQQENPCNGNESETIENPSKKRKKESADIKDSTDEEPGTVIEENIESETKQKRKKSKKIKNENSESCQIKPDSEDHNLNITSKNETSSNKIKKKKSKQDDDDQSTAIDKVETVIGRTSKVDANENKMKKKKKRVAENENKSDQINESESKKMKISEASPKIHKKKKKAKYVANGDDIVINRNNSEESRTDGDNKIKKSIF